MHKMITKHVTKNAKSYVCDICDYTCSKKSSWEQHNLTAKHKYKHEMMTNSDTEVNQLNYFNEEKEHECSCGKTYKHRQGLWTHKKKCTILNQQETGVEKEGMTLKMTDIQNAIPNMDMNLIFAFMKDTQEFKQIILEQSNAMMEYNKQMMSDQNKIMSELVEKVGNTTNINTQNNQNNQFNLNFFLNDTCKGAMNVKDFMNFINVDLEDIEYIGKHGYVAGISRIFAKNLARLGKFEKPIWVTDEKRETIMYKEDGVWKKDEDHIKMNRISTAIEHKCMKAITLWRDANPDWKENDKKGLFYSNMNGCIFGGELKSNVLHHPPDKDQKAKIVRGMLQHLKIPKKNLKEQILT